MRVHAEDHLQRAVVQYLAAALPDNALFFHVPNGGARSRVEAARFKGLGVVAGVADLIVLHAGRVIALELKAPKGRVSRVQQEWAARLKRSGGAWRCCRSVDEVQQVLIDHDVPLRARLAAGNGRRAA